MLVLCCCARYRRRLRKCFFCLKCWLVPAVVPGASNKRPFFCPNWHMMRIATALTHDTSIYFSVYRFISVFISKVGALRVGLDWRYVCIYHNR